MEKTRLSLLVGGDTILGEEPEKYFEGVDEILKNADVRVAQLETPYIEKADDNMDPTRELRNLFPLKGRFDVITLAGNHLYDFGTPGVADTTRWLRENGILYCGADMNLELAERPAIFEKNGVKFGFLNYNCVGPAHMYASETKAGCAYVNHLPACIVDNIDSLAMDNNLDDLAGKHGHFEEYPRLGDYMRMMDQIAALRPKCDVLSVYFHKGIVHKPAVVLEYERFISRVAIDSGADAVFASHAHILRGCEFYKGRPIFHGLNNFVACVPLLSPNYKGKFTKTEFSDQEEWNRNRVKRFGFVPDPDYPTYPFHPEAIYTVASKCIIEDGKITENRLIPIIYEKSGVPYVVKRGNGGERVMEYLTQITDSQNLNACYEWDGDEIVIRQK